MFLLGNMYYPSRIMMYFVCYLPSFASELHVSGVLSQKSCYNLSYFTGYLTRFSEADRRVSTLPNVLESLQHSEIFYRLFDTFWKTIRRSHPLKCLKIARAFLCIFITSINKVLQY